MHYFCQLSTLSQVNCLQFSHHPLSCLYQAMQMQKTISIANILVLLVHVVSLSLYIYNDKTVLCCYLFHLVYKM